MPHCGIFVNVFEFLKILRTELITLFRETTETQEICGVYRVFALCRERISPHKRGFMDITQLEPAGIRRQGLLGAQLDKRFPWGNDIWLGKGV